MKNRKTKVFNRTQFEITVKEGNAGTFSTVKKLQPYDQTTTKPDLCTIEVDQNATFREYWIVLPPEHWNLPKIIVTSDECVDNKHITINYNKEKGFSTDKTPRKCTGQRKAAGNGMVAIDQVNNNGAGAMVNLGGSTNPDNQSEIPPVTPSAAQEGKLGTKSLKWFSNMMRLILPSNWKPKAG